MHHDPDWSLKQAIKDHSHGNLQVTEIAVGYRESLFSFDEPGIVNGQIHTFIGPQMEISIMRLNSRKNISTRIEDGIERAVSTFIFNGHIRSEYFSGQRTLVQKSRQHSFTILGNTESEHIIKAGETSLVYINYQPAFIEALCSVENAQSNPLFSNLKQGNFYISSPSGFYKVAETLNALCACKLKGLVKSLFIEAKALELFSLQLEELQPGKKTVEPVAMPKADKEKLMALDEFISEEFMQPLSLKELSLKFGLNEFKLKAGYKKLFGRTVFGQINQLRMQHARQLLETGLHNVSAVSDIMGYSSISNFSAAFTKTHGFSPSVVKGRK